ncbi:MAG TPA: saccharopine dehydrogenase NADP-binding domain-containing protein [Candidatus Binatus sp.]|jgi:saccharopine dehydrogenase (NAD+, L-lysine-forming)|nr:saccharopine dehydrogenase NADP-binding domain-containing protein [Candidatus Binatus sp.]
MRIFVLGAGGTGSLLAHLLVRQGHTVWCGDRDPERAKKFLGKKSDIEVVEANARNLWSIVRAARGCNLLVNASPAVFNEIILRAALRLRSHYLDLNSHLTRSLFKPEQLRFHKRFTAKNRVALICTGAAPGLTNLLAKRGSELLDSVESIQLRLFESTESKDPVSTWSPEGAYDEAISSPRIYRNGRFVLAKRFAEREKFRFPPPIGETTVYLAAQDEVCMLPYAIPIRDMDAKIGGNDFDRLYRWFRQGRLNRSQGIVRKRFPKTLTPRNVAALIRRGILYNARFAAAVLLRGVKDEQPLLVRWDASFPSLFQIRQRGLISTPISYATAHVAALFVKHFPRDEAGVLEPEMLSADTRRAIVAELRSRDFRIKLKITKLKKVEEEF